MIEQILINDYLHRYEQPKNENVGIPLIVGILISGLLMIVLNRKK